jgi:futalosine hydrolase
VILLACAVGKELAFWKPRKDVELLVTGVGPVEAACSITHALAQRRYRLLVNAGLGGAFDRAAQVGDGVVVAHDALELNLESGGPLALPDAETVVDRAYSDPKLVAALQGRGFAVLAGITVTRVTASDETARRLATLGARIESMEGFAALRSAERAGVPAVELRGIANRVGARERSAWNFTAGTRGLERILEAFFDVVDSAEHELV